MYIYIYIYIYKRSLTLTVKCVTVCQISYDYMKKFLEYKVYGFGKVLVF